MRPEPSLAPRGGLGARRGTTAATSLRGGDVECHPCLSWAAAQHRRWANMMEDSLAWRLEKKRHRETQTERKDERKQEKSEREKSERKE